MAVFLLTARHGAGYTPPPCTGIFADVPCPGLYKHADYIEQFYREGITAGCSTAPLGYCPDAIVTKREAAVFLLGSREPAGYLPPFVPVSFSMSPVQGKSNMPTTSKRSLVGVSTPAAAPATSAPSRL
jgi:hypothetical protein